MPTDPPDFVSFLVALLAMIASKEIAYLVGPYAAIMVCASVGAALSLSGTEETMTIRKASGYVILRIFLAASLTIALAELLQVAAPWAKPRYTLIPLAFAMGWIRDYDTVRNVMRDAARWYRWFRGQKAKGDEDA